MKINLTWLQDYIEEKLPDTETLTQKIIFGAFEVEGKEVAANGDMVLDIKTLPDRNHDALSHYGMAKEVAGLLGLTLKKIEHKIHESIESDLKVTLKTTVCRRYLARKIFDVKVGPSPSWLSARLESIGARSINNVVDATNYVMFTLGQPIHAFDADKMGDGHIVVRQAYAGEEMLTLDGKLVPLDESIAVISNEKLDQPLAIAGIKGGKIAEVDLSTKSLIVEVANFDPIAVRKTAKKIGIQNDSSKRFENELTPYLCAEAMHMVTDLILQVAGGVAEDPEDEYPNPVHAREILFTSEEVNRLLGTDISISEMVEILNRYAYSFEESNGEFKLQVPFARIDITGAHDMAEEIGRVYGYEKIVAVLPIIAGGVEKNPDFEKIMAVKHDLQSKGYHEVMTYSFRKKGDYEVVRGPAGRSALRKNLSDGLKESYEMNLRSKDLLGLDEMKIFEVGTVFLESGEKMVVATADKSGIKEMDIKDYVTGTNTPQPSLKEREPHQSFVMWSEYPSITRDIAFWVPTSSNVDPILLIANTVHPLVSQKNFQLAHIRKFDTFVKDEKTSMAFRLVFQSFERTLTNEEVDEVMEHIYKTVKGTGFEIR